MSEQQMSSQVQAESPPAPDVKPGAKQGPPKSAPKKELTPAQMQKRRKRLVMPLFFLVFAGVMWLIFAPSKEAAEDAAGQDGFNSEVPMPEDDGLVSDKLTAYEQESQRERQQEKMRSLQDFSAMFGELGETEEERIAREERQIAMAPKPVEYYDHPEMFEGGGGSRGSTLQSSAYAYRDINRQLGEWYEEPEEEEPMPSAVEERILELERRLAEAEAMKVVEDEQAALLERSYQMAARYMPGAAQGAGNDAASGDGSSAPQAGQSGKAVARPVSQVRESVVSLLSAPMSDNEFVAAFSQPRNMGFLTAAGNEGTTGKNTIRACVYRTVTLTDGKELQIRLLEPMRADNTVIPAGTVVTGACGIEGERMEVAVNSIQYGGNIIPVELTVYDLDGQRGIAVPNSDEINAMREVASTLAQSAGTSITISDDAGSQLAADVGKGLIQGASQYVSKKMGIVRVTVKANYGLLLLPSTN
jgi:conjugative transposon TraM protein